MATLLLFLAGRSTPARAETAAAVSAGDQQTCALTTGGGVKCWGFNFSGELGDGTTTDRNTPVDASGLTSGVAAVSAAGFVNCALTTAGGVKCWGFNEYGYLGNGTLTTGGGCVCEPTAVNVCADATCTSPLSGVTAISAGFDHTCALTTAGGVKCWGANFSAGLGDGSTTTRTTPVDVCADATCTSPLSGVTAISAGFNHTCAVTTAGGVKCWGYNANGQLGDGTSTGPQTCGIVGFGCSTTPVDVSGLGSGVAAIAAGGNHTCALTTAGGVKCWGRNLEGELGDGTTVTSGCVCEPTAVGVSGLTTGVAAISAGGYHTCAVTTAGGLKCWASNFYGQLGNGTTTDSTTPVDVLGLTSGVAAVNAGSFHTCAVTTAGGVKCWGDSHYGQLGDGTNTGPETCNSYPCSTRPVDVVGFGAPMPIQRAVVFIQGIASQSRADGSCTDQTPGFIDPGSANPQWLADYLSNPSHVDGISLNQSQNFFYFSYSGLYCPDDSGGGFWDYRRPSYVSMDACGSVSAAADKLQTMLADLIARYPDVKFDIVAHSLGGLVAADWLSKHGDERSRVNSIVTFDSPLRGVGPAILTALYPCNTASDAWHDLECLDYNSLILCSSIIRSIGSDALTIPFFTLDARDLDYSLGGIGFEKVPGDRTTLLNSNSALHCSVDDNHPDVWGNQATKGGAAVCWENADPNAALPKYRVSPPGDDVKGIFVACAITAPRNPDACRGKMGGTLSAQTTVASGVAAGQTTVQVASVSGFSVGDWIRFNPGGSNQEDGQIVGFGSIHLASPLQFHHDAGEPLGEILAPANASPTPTPSPTATPFGQTPTPTPTATPFGQTPSPTPIPVTPPANSLGDTNCDGRIDGTDVMNVLADATGIVPASGCIDNGDVNNDGHITAMDGLLILKFWAGLINSFPSAGS